ncbi:MAG TPA: DUF1499 domain-containing protein [Stellaceae bacterium]|jgi:uncharacterized protein (DUF1499 family)|nr:DUF1499 domain-containing protein [Stellaceae bacterium]
MTIALTRRRRAGDRWRDRLVQLAALLAILAVLLLAIGPLGWRAGWWHFRTAFFYLMPGAAYCGLAAMGIAVLALIFGRGVGRRLAIGIVAFLIGAGIAYVPWQFDRLRGIVPPIHDVTTDPDNPPAFVGAAALRKAQNLNTTDYEPQLPAQQRNAYPDLVPITLNLPPKEAFDRALATAQRLGWTITETDPATGHIEATETSRWFRFVDDIVIRIVPADIGSRIDLRSSSRVGRSDFGVNANRIRRFADAVKQAP